VVITIKPYAFGNRSDVWRCECLLSNGRAALLMMMVMMMLLLLDDGDDDAAAAADDDDEHTGEKNPT